MKLAFSCTHIIFKRFLSKFHNVYPFSILSRLNNIYIILKLNFYLSGDVLLKDYMFAFAANPLILKLHFILIKFPVAYFVCVSFSEQTVSTERFNSILLYYRQHKDSLI